MQITSITLTFLTCGTTLVSAALPKANEYTSSDCSGDLNYGHHTFDLHEVTMDDSSHSVYQAGTNWYLFSGKASDGGPCEGKILGQVTADTVPCIDIDNSFEGERIRCLCNPLIGANGGSCAYLATES